MRALLITRCGCTRHMEVGLKPPTDILLPLAFRPTLKQIMETPPDPNGVIQTRLFIRGEDAADGEGLLVCYYEEG